jgi:tetratricopeptide (TPR) repeat protein
MSYIHKALLKAQKEKDSRFPKYKTIFSGPKGKLGGHSAKIAWFISFIIILLAFVIYTWLDSHDKAIVSSPENQKTMAHYKVEAASSDGEEFFDQAKYLQKVGRLREAQRLYKQALSTQPGNAAILNNLGVIYLQEHNYSQARANLERAIRLKPDYVDPYYNLACLYAINGNAMESLRNLKKAISLDKSVADWAQKDKDLQNLKDLSEFETITGKK